MLGSYPKNGPLQTGYGQGIEPTRSMSNMNELQRKGFLNIVQENGTYNDFYRTRYEKADSGLVAKNQTAITAHLKLLEEKKAIEKKNQETIGELQKKADKEIQIQYDKHTAERKTLEKKLSDARIVIERAQDKVVNAVEVKSDKLCHQLQANGLKLEYAGYNSSERDHRWEIDESRFRDTYDNWRRNITAEILAAVDAKDALKLVKEFIPKVN